MILFANWLCLQRKQEARSQVATTIDRIAEVIPTVTIHNLPAPTPLYYVKFVAKVIVRMVKLLI